MEWETNKKEAVPKNRQFMERMDREEQHNPTKSIRWVCTYNSSTQHIQQLSHKHTQGQEFAAKPILVLIL